jgi:hypothetical protein
MTRKEISAERSAVRASNAAQSGDDLVLNIMSFIFPKTLK